MPGILDDFPRGDEKRLLTQHDTPKAAWRNPQDILRDTALAYPADNPGGRLLLGNLDGRLIGVADDRHMITVAGSRAGKGVSVIIPNLIFYPGSVLAIDPKGELASITARRRARDLKQKVFVLDPFGRTADWVKPYRASFNPMATLTPGNPHIVEDAGLIADAIVVPSGGDMGNAGVLQFFGNNDVKTLEYISRRLGKTTILVKSAGDVTPQQQHAGATGSSRKPEVHDLLTAEEAGRYFARDAPQLRQLIIRAGKDPAMVIGRVRYYEDAPFRGKFDDIGAR